MKTQIASQLDAFLTRYKVPQCVLAREAGVSPVLLNKIVTGKQKDTTSTNADKLRDAMDRLQKRITTKNN